jgi:hypothetical protein
MNIWRAATYFIVASGLGTRFPWKTGELKQLDPHCGLTLCSIIALRQLSHATTVLRIQFTPTLAKKMQTFLHQQRFLNI